MMQCYHSAVLDERGQFSRAACKDAILTALRQWGKDVSLFQLPPAPVLEPYVPDEAGLEEISDSEDEETQNVTTPVEITESPSASRTPVDVRRGPRLKLVFDLDNTLLHAVCTDKLHVRLKLEDFRDDFGRPEMYRFARPRKQGAHYYIKFRRGARELIRAVSKFFDLAIHTNATREYADIVMSILDPDRSLFGCRVAARDDDSGKNEHKEMSRLFSSDRETLIKNCLILDDRRDVWGSEYEKNLIQCNYYEFFDSRKSALEAKYGDKQVSLSPTKATTVDLVGDVLDSYEPGDDMKPVESTDMADERILQDYDRQLVFLQGLMLRVTEKFYNLRDQGADPSVGDLLMVERGKVLEGCVCLLTGFAHGEGVSTLDNRAVHQRRLEYMGARVVQVLDATNASEVTHVVVIRQTMTTQKAQSMCGPSTKFVHSLWIYACEQTWTRVDESFFRSTELLLQWPDPPARPTFQHWPYTCKFYEILVASRDRSGLQQPTLDMMPVGGITTPGVPPVIPTVTGVAIAPPGSHKRKLPQDVVCPGTTKRYRLSPDLRTSREWIASGQYSHGAEVWSPHEHVVLKFDPCVSANLSHKSRLAVT